ncbi:TcaA second domain-containing protein [Peribacillus sp. NPDC006672]|uniref:TcaA second domain-containing protein n=1 Tax=Peribacillus sp. NPDC006672 TaxID=3390606 RepID=UPI003D06C2ED
MSKKIWIISGISAFTIIILIAAVLLIQQNNKPKKVVESFTEAVKKKDSSQLKDLIQPDKKGAIVNNASIKAFASYLNSNNSSFEAIKDGLKEQIEDKSFSATNQQVSLVESGKKWGIFKEYRLKVKTGFIKVTGHNDDDDISITIDELKESVRESKKDTYGPLLPGTYEIVTTVQNKLGTFMKKDKLDVWGGSKEITLVVDPNVLVRGDKDVQKAVMSAVDIFNYDLTVFETSGFDTDKFTNVTDAIKNDTSIAKDNFATIEDFVDEIHSQYLGAVINLDELDISYFDNQWIAEAEALVSYKNKMRIKNQKKLEDFSYKSMRVYSLIYNADKKKWLIDDIKETDADGAEQENWDNKQEMKIKNPKLLTWNRKDSGEKF